MTAGQPPAPVADLDTQLRVTIRQAHRVRWLLVWTAFLLLVATVIVLTVTVVGQQSELKASCGFWKPLTGLPVTAAPPQAKPAPLAVGLIVASRVAYEGQGCGRIPPPSPSLVRWARYYGIKVP